MSMDDDPRFQTTRMVERNRGAGETERLERGERTIEALVGPQHAKAFLDEFAKRCGPALPTALVQLLDFAERRCNPTARQRDPAMARLFEKWREPGAVEDLYLNACVEDYSRDKAWAQESGRQRERAISMARFKEKLGEATVEGAVDKAKEVFGAISLAAGLSFASDSMELVDKLPSGIKAAVEECAAKGVELLASVHGFSPHAMGSLAVGLAAAGTAIVAKSVLCASWTAWSEQRKREKSACELPRSLALLDRDKGWEPYILGVPSLSSGLVLAEVPEVMDVSLLDVLEANRRALRGHTSLVASEVRTTWSLLTQKQRALSREMPAKEAVALAAMALVALRTSAKRGGYGSLDYASLPRPERERIVQAVFKKSTAEDLASKSPKSVGDVEPRLLDPLVVKGRLLARRPLGPVLSGPVPLQGK